MRWFETSMQLVCAIRPGHVAFGLVCGLAAASDLADAGATVLAFVAGMLALAAMGAETAARGGV